MRTRKRGLMPGRGGVGKSYLSLGEGYGTAYERYAFDRFAGRIVREYGISEVLELPADGIMGIPGLKSLIFAELGCDVTVAHHSRRLLRDARRLWDTFGLKASFVMTHYLRPAFKDDAFDLVWNFCVLEHVGDARSMIREMFRVTRRYVLIEIQNVFNVGLPLHRWYHLVRGEPWDHGDMRRMKLSYVERLVKGVGGRVVETGATDMPPWPDINMRLGEEHRSKGEDDGLRPGIRTRPVAEVVEELGKSEGGSASALWSLAERLFGIWYELVESKVPTPLKVIFAHHPYLIAEKCR